MNTIQAIITNTPPGRQAKETCQHKPEPETAPKLGEPPGGSCDCGSAPHDKFCRAVAREEETFEEPQPLPRPTKGETGAPDGKRMDRQNIRGGMDQMTAPTTNNLPIDPKLAVPAEAELNRILGLLHDEVCRHVDTMRERDQWRECSDRLAKELSDYATVVSGGPCTLEALKRFEQLKGETK